MAVRQARFLRAFRVYSFAQGNPAKVVARCGVPLSGPTSYAEFLDNLVPLTGNDGQTTVAMENLGLDRSGCGQ